MQSSISHIKYEVFGKVQGVYFRKFTKTTADSLSLLGSVQNTKTKTVIGEAIGDHSNILKFKEWLTTVGSPSSRIDKTEIKITENYTSDYSKFKEFKIIK